MVKEEKQIRGVIQAWQTEPTKIKEGFYRIGLKAYEAINEIGSEWVNITGSFEDLIKFKETMPIGTTFNVKVEKNGKFWNYVAKTLKTINLAETMSETPQTAIPTTAKAETLPTTSNPTDVRNNTIRRQALLKAAANALNGLPNLSANDVIEFAKRLETPWTKGE